MLPGTERFIARQERDRMEHWALHQDFLRQGRARKMQPDADRKLGDVRNGLEELIDTQGRRHADPVFTVVEFTRHVPWGDGTQWLVSAWSVITPGLPRVSELYLASSKERLRFDQEGVYLYKDVERRNEDGEVETVAIRDRKLNIYDVNLAQGILENITKSFS